MSKKTTVFPHFFCLLVGVILSLVHAYLPLNAMESERLSAGEISWSSSDESVIDVPENERCREFDTEAILSDSDADGMVSQRDRWRPFWQQRDRAVKAAQKRRGQREAQPAEAPAQGNVEVQEPASGNNNEDEASPFGSQRSALVAGGVALAAGIAYWFKDEMLSVMESIGLREPADSDDEESDGQDEYEVKTGWTTKQKAALSVAAASGAAATYYAYNNREALSQAAQEKTEQISTYVRENPRKTFAGGALVGALIYGIKGLVQRKSGENRSASEEKRAVSLFSYMQHNEPPTLSRRCTAQFERLHTDFVTSLKSKVLRHELEVITSEVKAATNPTYYFCYEFETELTDEQRQMLWQLVQYFVTHVVPHMKLNAVEYAHYTFLGTLGLEHYTNQLFEAYRQFISENTIAYYSPMALSASSEKQARKEFIAALVLARQKSGW